MTESKIVEIRGRAIPVPGNDIDTDRIIPARYMKTVTFEGLGKFAFYDARFDADGKPKQHPFNDERFKGAGILLVNKNFGCGSSREHAPQSLLRYGIKAIVGESFAEIFAGNCSMLGIPAVRVSEKDVLELMRAVEKNPNAEISVNLETEKISAGGKEFPFSMPESARRNLVSGNWDTVSQLVSAQAEAKKTFERLPYLHGFKD
ncbi:MAG: 3-isopropylmalate dehydratase small subunit [Candidatus Diapherotrites archaeon]|nr:3-isopropylmalate dehydratase small subunit [Candidatus Diapherotrites archaeon]